MFTKLVRVIRAPLAILLVVITIDTLAYFKIVPSVDEITSMIVEGIENFGLLVVGTISFLENLIGLNVYFPGSVIIILAMAQTAGDPQRAIQTYLVIYAFAFLAYNVNFLIGRYYFRDKNIKPREKLAPKNTKYSSLWVQFMTTFWHPHFAAVTCLYVGSKGYKYSEIIKYMLIASFVWNTTWAITIYNLGMVTKVTSLNLKALVIAYLIGWILLDSYKFLKEEKILELRDTTE